jgi:hypothetical protein
LETNKNEYLVLLARLRLQKAAISHHSIALVEHFPLKPFPSINFTMQSMVKVSSQASRGQLSKAATVAVNNCLNVDAAEAKAHLSPLAKTKVLPGGKQNTTNYFSLSLVRSLFVLSLSFLSGLGLLCEEAPETS